MPEYLDAEKHELRDNESSTLASVVGFFFAFRAFIMVLSVRILGTDPQTGTAISLAAGGLLLLLVAFCTVGQNTRPLRQIATTASVRCALFYLAFSCLS